MTTPSVAVVGATGLIGEALLSLLAEDKLATDSVYAVDSPAEAGKRVDFGDTRLKVSSLADFDFSTVAIAFFCVPADVVGEWAPPAVAAGCHVIHWSDAVQPQGTSQARYIAADSALVSMLATVLRPLVLQAGLTRLDASAVLAVSERGRAGVKELAGQTARLLNVQNFEPDTFAAQIAFNVLPATLADGDAAALAESLGCADAPVQLSAVFAPVFFGHSVHVQMSTEKPLDVETARGLLADVEGVDLVDAGEGPVTAVSHAANQDEICVSELRDSASLANTLELRLVADNIRCGAALNGIKIAESLVKDLQ